MKNFTISRSDALIVVDPQLDFCPGGALAVADGDAIMRPISILAQNFDTADATIVLTQDWHPFDHQSFASSHEVEPFSMIAMPYGDQVAWPDHCTQGDLGATFHFGIREAEELASIIIRKGMNPNIDSYSAFYENDQTTKTGLAGFLRDRGITRCFFVGLAYDFCVGYSALDARREGFEAVVVKDYTRAINMPVNGVGTTSQVIEQKFALAGVIVDG